MSNHSELTDSSIHTPFRWIWADAAARAAETDIESEDVNKVGLQLDSGTLWLLSDLTPTWLSIGGGGNLDVAFTVGAEASDVITVSAQLQINGVNVSGYYVLQAVVSEDDPMGELGGGGTGGTPPSGGIEYTFNGGYLTEFIADVYISIITDGDGRFDLDVTHSGAGTYFFNIILPDGTIRSSDAMTFA